MISEDSEIKRKLTEDHAFDSILDGTATYISVTDPLDPEHKAKTYVSYGRFRVAYQGDGIENVK